MADWYPALETDFQLDWNFVNETQLATLNDQFGQDLIVRFNNVELKLGLIANEILAPIVNDIKTMTDPIAPALDLLNTPVPVISDAMSLLGLSDGDITVLEMLKIYDANNALPPN